MRIEPVSLFGPSAVTYTPKIDPIKREIEFQKRKKQELKKRRTKVAEKLNLIAANYTDVMLSYDENINATNPYHFSFDKES